MKYLTELLKYKDKLGDFQGLSDSEINKFEEELNIKLPLSYREYLSHFGKDSGFFMSGYSMTLDKVNKNRELAIYELNFDESLPIEDRPAIKDEFLFIGNWQGYNFFFIDISENQDNPTVYLFDTEEIKLYKKTLTDFFLDEGITPFLQQSI